MIRHIDATTHILKRATGEGITSFKSSTLEKSYNFRMSEINMKTKWVKSLKIYYIAFIKQAWILGKCFCQRENGEYERKVLKQLY